MERRRAAFYPLTILMLVAVGIVVVGIYLNVIGLYSYEMIRRSFRGVFLDEEASRLLYTFNLTGTGNLTVTLALGNAADYPVLLREISIEGLTAGYELDCSMLNCTLAPGEYRVISITIPPHAVFREPMGGRPYLVRVVHSAGEASAPVYLETRGGGL